MSKCLSYHRFFSSDQIDIGDVLSVILLTILFKFGQKLMWVLKKKEIIRRYQWTAATSVNDLNEFMLKSIQTDFFMSYEHNSKQ